MPQSGVRYVVTLQDLTAPAFNTMNANANKVEATIAGLQRNLNGLAGTIGAGIGIYAIKNAVSEYAKYEQSLIRIKNVSESVTEGIKNQNFILSEAKKFKIDIAEATDSFGEFLTMIRGAHIASSDVRKLHDELLLIGKVTALPQSQMDASVRNLGKLLEEGALEGRHVRPLMYQLSGLAPYVAKQLNLTTQEFEKFLSSGKMTKAAIDSKILITAISQYASDLTPKLSESLNSTQSSLNELHNAFFEMKNDLVLALKPNIMGFISMMKDSAYWISENSDMVATLIKGVVGLSIAYKGVNIASGVASLMGGAGGIGTAVSSGAGLGLSVVGGALLVALTAGSIAMLVESLKPTSNADNTTDIDHSNASSVFKNKLYNFITKGDFTLSQTKQEADEFARIASLRSEIESSLKTIGNFTNWNIGNSQKLGIKAYGVLPDIIREQINTEVGNYIARGEKKPAVNYARIGNFLEALQADKDIIKNISEGKQQGFEMLQLWKSQNNKDADNPFAKNGGIGKLLGLEKDEIKGNRPQTYNVYIKEMNGNKDCTFELQSLDKMDVSAFGRRIADILLSVTNDTQLKNGN